MLGNNQNTASKWERNGFSTPSFEQGQNSDDFVIREINRPGSIGHLYQNPNRKEKQEKIRKYAFGSDIQEIADMLQSLYASGTAFSRQKTTDMTESEYRMLPFEMAKIISKMLGCICLVYLIHLVVTLVCLKYDFAIGYSYPLPISIFFVSFMFYAYIVYSMKQFVIEDESQPKTKQFFNIVMNSWKAIEVFMVFVMFVLVSLYFTQSFWLNTMNFWLGKIGYFFTLKNVQDTIAHLMAMSFIINGFYFVFIYLAKRRFKKMQQENTAAIYHQYSLHLAATKKLDFEI